MRQLQQSVALGAERALCAHLRGRVAAGASQAVRAAVTAARTRCGLTNAPTLSSLSLMASRGWMFWVTMVCRLVTLLTRAGTLARSCLMVSRGARVVCREARVLGTCNRGGGEGGGVEWVMGYCGGRAGWGPGSGVDRCCRITARQSERRRAREIGQRSSRHGLLGQT